MLGFDAQGEGAASEQSKGVLGRGQLGRRLAVRRTSAQLRLSCGCSPTGTSPTRRKARPLLRELVRAAAADP